MAKEGAMLSGVEPVERARGMGQRAETGGRSKLSIGSCRGKSMDSKMNDLGSALEKGVSYMDPANAESMVRDRGRQRKKKGPRVIWTCVVHTAICKEEQKSSDRPDSKGRSINESG